MVTLVYREVTVIAVLCDHNVGNSDLILVLSNQDNEQFKGNNSICPVFKGTPSVKSSALAWWFQHIESQK